MARPLRICFAGAVYHLTSRGNARERIFLDEFDFEAFLGDLAEAIDRYGWLCHAYCLMDNHHHLLIETPKPNLSRGMRHLNGVYAQGFNLRHERCGHVFGGRFGSKLVEKDSHLLECARYIVLNPVRAGVCTRPGDYRWSSYRATAGLDRPPAFLTTEWILKLFAPTRKAAQKRYRDFVAAGVAEAIELAARGERVGSEPFLRDRFGYDPPLPEIPREQIEPLPPPLDELLRDRIAPISTAYRRHGYTLREIAEHFGCHYSTISRRLRDEERGLHDARPDPSKGV
jgi:REP element-mobilizing transposase RayT